MPKAASASTTVSTISDLTPPRVDLGVFKQAARSDKANQGNCDGYYADENKDQTLIVAKTAGQLCRRPEMRVAIDAIPLRPEFSQTD